MRLDNQKRLRYIQFALGLALFSAGCNNSTDVGKSTSTAPPQTTLQPQAEMTAKPLSASLEPPKEMDLVPHAKHSFYTVDHYGEDRNVEVDLKMTMARAATEKKRILLQVGGDWCGWCKLLTAFVEKDGPVRSSLEKNYLLMKVTYTAKQTNEAFLSKYPATKGYPHLYVLDAEGKLLHSQDTTPLEEEGKGYNEERVLAFLETWKLPNN